ncbi:DNA/RNA helicase domain-containing protein [Microbacterium sp. G2-8]|uniref:DNA/RNA helicase domain-containing protein n=1 Tax=Microbacterium sp. G2-8 TaxID=2842454 RepID=UPI0021AA7206|nr:DNA/RNA helicase domain-containing protein [Microbacterium sp. G2-8]
MTSFSIERHRFTDAEVARLAGSRDRYSNWPVVYLLNDERSIYVGETLNAAKRLRQHRDPKSHNRDMKQVRIVLGDEFNKSACLDLESQLIRYFSGDGQRQVKNRNDGVTDADYFDRHRYQPSFDAIFDALRAEDMFTKSRHEIENSDLFKLSPFKALTVEQRAAVEGILDGLFDDLAAGRDSMSVIQGAAGTGKTIVAIYLIKLLSDIAAADDIDAYESDSVFSDYFQRGFPRLAQGLRIGFVIPQQSLRTSVQAVFKRTPGLTKHMVMSQFDAGKRDEHFDLLVVDEAHRLTRRANQSSGGLNRDYRVINEKLFGRDDDAYTQLDWIRAKSTHQIFLMDSGQSVRPADISLDTQRALRDEARGAGRWHHLMTQMRVKAGTDYVGWVRDVLSGNTPDPVDLGEYDFRFFDSPTEMREAILQRERESGLSRMLAGYGYEWRSRRDPLAYDIEIGDFRMRWNSKTTDWINSPRSVDEAGSIHTVQGYDLNYVGVIIGPELYWDPVEERIRVDRDRYFDKKGKENNPKLGIVNGEAELNALIVNIYVVLMTRGMLGTYVYVHDAALRERLRGVFGNALR